MYYARFNRREVALVFDSAQIENTWYGLPVHVATIPLFEKASFQSVLSGDLLGENRHQARIRSELERAITRANSFEYHHSTQFYVLYVNNLSKAMVDKFHAELHHFRPYIGYIDCTYSSFMKTYLSSALSTEFIKAGPCILQKHEDDLDEDANRNTIGYPFEDFGYVVKSIPSTMFDILLSFKIERPIFPGFESDTEFSLNAVSAKPSRLDGFDVVIEPAKLQYLIENKAGSLKKAGLLNLEATRLEEIIREKLQLNYIYNLCQDDQHGVVTFNILVEQQACRLLVALEYMPEDRQLRLITMY
jgi:hypothetical protein